MSAAILEAAAAVLESQPDAAFVVRPDGEVVACNAAARALGWGPAGHSCGSCPPASCPGCLLQAAFRSGLADRVSLEREGRYWEVSSWPLRGPGGGPVGAVQSLRDLTLVLGVERYLIESAEAGEERLGALRRDQADLVGRDRVLAAGRLVAALSHEIHTPLGAVASGADLLRRHLERLRAGEGGEVRLSAMERTVGTVGEAARRIEGVVRTFRSFVHLDASAVQEVDLRESLDAAVALLSYRIAGNVRVERAYGEILPVRCRPDEMNQVFLNLLQNALQALPEGGRIALRTRAEGEDVVVEIADDGVGIAPEILPRLGEMGFTTRARGGGSGIGLALSRRILERHGGTLAVDGAPGRGATVTLRIPREGVR